MTAIGYGISPVFLLGNPSLPEGTVGAVSSVVFEGVAETARVTLPVNVAFSLVFAGTTVATATATGSVQTVSWTPPVGSAGASVALQVVVSGSVIASASVRCIAGLWARYLPCMEVTGNPVSQWGDSAGSDASRDLYQTTTAVQPVRDDQGILYNGRAGTTGDYLTTDQATYGDMGHLTFLHNECSIIGSLDVIEVVNVSGYWLSTMPASASSRGILMRHQGTGGVNMQLYVGNGSGTSFLYNKTISNLGTVGSHTFGIRLDATSLLMKGDSGTWEVGNPTGTPSTGDPATELAVGGGPSGYPDNDLRYRALYIFSAKLSEADADAVMELADRSRASVAYITTNLADATNWTKGALASVTSQIDDPWGNQCAYALVEGTATGSHYISQTLTSLEAGPVDICCYLKKPTGGRDYALIYISGTGSGGIGVNLTTGEATIPYPGATIRSVTYAGSDWWRIDGTFQCDGTNKAIRVYSGNDALGNSYTGDSRTALHVFVPRRGVQGQPINITTLPSDTVGGIATNIAYEGVPCTIAGTATGYDGYEVSVTVNGQAFGTSNVASGAWSVTATPTAAMVGAGVRVQAKMAGIHIATALEVFSPRTYATSGWVPCESATETYGKVSSLNDLVSTNHFTQSTADERPVLYDAGAARGRVLRFDGTDDSLACTFAWARPQELWILTRSVTPFAGARIVSDVSNNNTWCYTNLTATSFSAYFGSTVTKLATATNWNAVGVGIADPDGATVMVGGVNGKAPSTGNVGTTASTGLRLARIGASGAAHACDIAELWIFARELVTLERERMAAYLAARWPELLT